MGKRWIRRKRSSPPLSSPIFAHGMEQPPSRPPPGWGCSRAGRRPSDESWPHPYPSPSCTPWVNPALIENRTFRVSGSETGLWSDPSSIPGQSKQPPCRFSFSQAFALRNAAMWSFPWPGPCHNESFLPVELFFPLFPLEDLFHMPTFRETSFARGKK